MLIDDSVLDPREKTGFRLRELYHGAGFERYRMSKFEEYDLYSRNKDFLFSDGVITFNDTTGRLLAMKPDVTLSIIKNGRDNPGGIRKVYYHENVYRVTSASDGFRESTQVGLECMGDVDAACISTVIELAAESLKLCSDRFVLEISHLDILDAFVDAVVPDGKVKRMVLRCAGEKNFHGISDIFREQGLREGAEDGLIRLLSLYGQPRTVLPKIKALSAEYGAEEYAAQLAGICASFAGSGFEDNLLIDFSATGDTKYYNGIAFKGFISGIPGCVLSGGQYDNLMRRMGRRDRAIGFAVFLDMLERLSEGDVSDA